MNQKSYATFLARQLGTTIQSTDGDRSVNNKAIGESPTGRSIYKYGQSEGTNDIERAVLFAEELLEIVSEKEMTFE